MVCGGAIAHALTGTIEIPHRLQLLEHAAVDYANGLQAMAP